MKKNRPSSLIPSPDPAVSKTAFDNVLERWDRRSEKMLRITYRGVCALLLVAALASVFQLLPWSPLELLPVVHQLGALKSLSRLLGPNAP